MNKNRKLNARRKALHIAVAAALPALMIGGNAHAAGNNPCTVTGSVVNCSSYNGQSGALMVTPSNYNAVNLNGDNPTSKTVVGLASADGNANINTPLSVSNPTTLNIGASSTIVTGLVDLVTGLPSPNATLYNYEGIELQQPGTINNYGTITNNKGTFTSNNDGSATLSNNGDVFYTQNGYKVYFSGDDGTTPQRTIGAWLSGSNTTLNNYGTITVGATNASISDTNLFSNVPGAPLSKGTLYTVFMNTSGDLLDQVKLNNYGTISAYNLTTGSDVNTPSISTVEVKENVLNGYIFNAKTGLIAGYSDRLTANGTATAPNYTNGIGSSVYTSASGSVQAINSDNNSINIYIDNQGTLASYAVTYNSATGAIGAPSTTVYGTAITDSLSNMNLYNEQSGKILGDITVGNQSNAFTFKNAGAMTGNIAITPDAGLGNATSATPGATITSGTAKLIPVAAGTLTAAQTANEVVLAANPATSTASLSVPTAATVAVGQIVISGTYAFQVVQAGITGTAAFPGISGALTTVTDSQGTIYETTTPTTQKNLITIQPVVTGSANASGQLTGGTISGGIYVNGVTGYHPLEIDIQPLVAPGAVVRTGNTYQFSGQNINIASAAKDWNTTTNALESVTASNVQVKSSALVNWSFVPGTTDQVVATVANASSISGLSGSGQNALNSLLNSVGSAGNGAASLVQNLATSDQVRQAGEQLRPEINGANIQAALNVTNKVFGLVDSHLNETHLAQLTGKSGIATGEQPNSTGVWMQGFGFRGNQDVRKSVDGYSADAYGFAIGADRLVNNNTSLGGAFSYANSSIDDKGVNYGNRTQIDSYQATLYSSMLLDNWYLNGALGLGKHNYDSKRLVLGADVIGSHEAWQYTAKIDAGLPVKVGSATVTPVASLTYSRLNQDAYTESGVSALAIRGSDTNSFRSGLGAKALIPLHEGDVKTALELRAIWNHEFGNTEQNTTANFIGGGSEFTASGVSTARDGADLGASLRLSGSDNVMKQSLLLSYDAEIKDQYFSQTVLLQARFDF